MDLTGLALAPGFIDIHSHTDLGLSVEPGAPSKIRPGVTTEVTASGNPVPPLRAEPGSFRRWQIELGVVGLR